MTAARFLVIFAALVMMAAPASADSPEGRVAAAKAYVKVADVPKMMNEMVNAMAQNPQLGLTPEHTEQIRAMFNHAEIENLMVEKMTKHFTEEELLKLADFYGSPEGQSIMKKMPAYMSDVMPFVQQKVADAVQKARAQQQTTPTTP
ncbi:MAG TPA: DUF2059 domain-containing protein [Alphaproteobacteria bacterium]|jgi:uncharacterized protein|nr:DUF2059 domain-containing protein [Micavibrio sp.]HQX26598.1 DUF2059 domain-containing protein [Alphaproteobacteria bacterium]